MVVRLAPALAVVQNSVKATQRTISGAMLLLVLNLIGLGGGPTMIGILSDHFNEGNLAAAGLNADLCKTAVDAAKVACGTASADGLQTALYFLLPFYIIAVLALLVMAFYIKKEVANGPPSEAAMARNATRFKLLVGFGGIAIILIAEQFLTNHPKMGDIHAFVSLVQGNAFGTGAQHAGGITDAQVLNGLIRDLLMILMAIFGIWGLKDVFKKKAA